MLQETKRKAKRQYKINTNRKYKFVEFHTMFQKVYLLPGIHIYIYIYIYIYIRNYRLYYCQQNVIVANKSSHIYFFILQCIQMLDLVKRDSENLITSR